MTRSSATGRYDAIIIGGGNKFYLSFWMEKSGLFDLLPNSWIRAKSMLVPVPGV